eukprot:2309876-Rhodomonas_salina.1
MSKAGGKGGTNAVGIRFHVTQVTHVTLLVAVFPASAPERGQERGKGPEEAQREIKSVCGREYCGGGWV